MADRLILAQALGAAAALLLPVGSTAQALTDPTRPPLELIRASMLDPATGEPVGAAPRPRVESIMLSSERKGAIINGRYVPLGGMYGKATLVSITATGITLETDREREVIQLYPNREKAPGGAGSGNKSEKTVNRP